MTRSNDICALLAASTQQYGDRVALSGPDGELSYRQLDQWSSQLAGRMRRETRDPDRPVLILAATAVDTIVAMIAALKAGIVYAALDTGQAPKRLLRLIESTAPALVVCDAAGQAVLDQLDWPDAAPAISAEGGAGEAPAAVADGERAADAPCYIYYTSGSTGEPKGILGRYKAIGHFANWEAQALQLDDTVRVSQLTTPSFDAMLRDVFTPLALGGTICVPPARAIIADGAALAAWLARARVSLLHTIPSTLRILMQAAEADPAFSAGALRHVCVAGEALLPVDVARFRRLFGDAVSLYNFYGPSETTMIKLFHKVEAADAERASVPIGKPIDGARAVILDAQQRRVGNGMIGEIYIRTPYRSLGYYRRPDLTEQVFVPNPLGDDPADIVYRTGDLGRVLESGEIEFAGRRDRQVKINGVRIEIAEIENIVREHPSVRDVAIIEHEGYHIGTELVAYVVAADGLAVEQLRPFILERAHAGMVPHHLIAIEQLPRTASGKLNYAELPQPDLSADEGPFVAPQSPLEQAVADIWTDLLQVDELSVNAHFFRVGGHSLLAMQVLSRVEAAFSVNIALRDFLIQPTIRSLAEEIGTALLVDASESDDMLLQSLLATE
ncbi:amino acid adenylation domain-containing protein [Rugamonas sp. FT82W]|uniref:Amino acid adenylation domain-containing protein n=1 Tax=Duganella vulcania TaxID=2692166 RepID=A0A845GAL3_9BURK|nr:amino acid adenylation domain-containing protein [Duganella vulcania]